MPLTRAALTPSQARSLKPWLFARRHGPAARRQPGGARHGRRARHGGPRPGGAAIGCAARLLASPLAALLPHPADVALAADQKPGDAAILDKIDVTHLAYVVTGDDQVDYVSKRGLTGLSEFLTYHTALEPGPPVGLDIAKDPLAFYPMIYWPISVSAPMPVGRRHQPHRCLHEERRHGPLRHA